MPTATRQCRHCKSRQRVETMTAINGAYYCDIDHAIVYAQKQGRKIREKQARQEKAKHRRQKREFYEKDIKTRREAAVREFNRFIRLRDAAAGCVSCGAVLSGKFDAGHFISAGSCTALRFDESNVHGQCVRCNQHLSGNHRNYRDALVSRIGAGEVARLEGPQPTIKITAEWYKSIEDEYKVKCKQLEAGALPDSGRV